MNCNNRILLILVSIMTIAAAILTGCSKSDEPAQPEAQSTKAERNFIREGNKLFDDENYADAEIAYSKALQANPASATAAYNMGLALAKQAAEGDTTGLAQRADSLFNHAAQLTQDKKLKSMAFYNMGNLSYNAQQYDRAIEAYKNALRNVPTDDDARYNLRMAQLKLQEQQQQQQNQGQNKQDQNQDQQNQDKQNQDQQNQDQNKDKQDQQQGQDQQSKQDQAKPEQGQEQQGKQGQGQPINMDERSVQQVLKAMQDKEKETQQKIYQMGERQRERERQATRNRW